MQFGFVVCQAEGYQNILELCCRPLAFNSYKGLLKNKNRCATSLPVSIFVSLLVRKSDLTEVLNQGEL